MRSLPASHGAESFTARQFFALVVVLVTAAGQYLRRSLAVRVTGRWA